MPVKKIEGTASLEDIEAEVNKEAQQKPRRNRKKTISIILVLGVIASGLVLFDLFTTQNSNTGYAVGGISGTVVNKQHTPVAADVFLLKAESSTVADKNGRFLLKNVPAGDQKVIVAWQGMGKEIPVSINSNETVDIGIVEVEETQLPPE